MDEATYYQRNREVMLNRAKEHDNNNKTKLREQGRNKYSMEEIYHMVFCRKGVLRNFAKFTEKYLRSATLFEKGLWHRCFPVIFAKFLRTSFF